MPSLVMPVLGVPVRFDAQTPALADAVEAAFGAWRTLDRRPELVTTPPAGPPRIRLRLTGSQLRSRPPGPLAIRTRPGGWLRLSDPGRLSGGARLDRMRGRLRIAPGALHNPRSIQHALDTLTLFLLTRLDREPVHAAAIATGDGRGLVLAGPSGIGKSTLALAALRDGLRVLTDDAVYLQLHPRLRVWGMGRPLHVSPATAKRFPGITGRAAVPRPGGTPKLPVEPEPAGAARLDPGVIEHAGLCILERGDAGPVVAPISADEAVRALLSRLDPGFDQFRDSIPERLHALAAGGAWRVRLGPRPEESLPALRKLFREIPR